ncbi:MAG: hypothetical protein GX624_11285 [Actinobacteria bacterium]|nr:hypothetical protein [Actinomycetota bacterium]
MPGAVEDQAIAQGIYELASEIRLTEPGRYDDECDELIDRAQQALAAHTENADPARVLVGTAIYLGGHSSLGPRRAGKLWISREHVGLQPVLTTGPTGGAALAMSEVSRIAVDGDQVEVSKVLPVLAFGVLGLAAKGLRDRTFVMVHTADGQCAVYEVSDRSHAQVRASIAPTLAAAGVPLDGGLSDADERRAGAAGDLVGQLTQLAGLDDRGKLTDEEYAAFKAKLME